MILETFVLGPIENNNYLLVDEDSREAVLFDCTQESEEIENALEKHNANLKFILLTHGHFDHVLGVNTFRNKYNCQVLIHEEDKIMLDNMKDFTKFFGLGEPEIQKVDGFVKEGDVIKFGNKEIKVIHTPGHTKGGVCYLVENKLFSGDTLFLESVGRTDLPGGNFNEIKSSIQNKLFNLDKNTEVYPGHGPTTTIEHEKVNNAFL